MRIHELIASYPRKRPPLGPRHAAVYAEQYRINREGARLVEGMAQRLESWMHVNVSRIRGGPVLELGAGTLNHLKYESGFDHYDVVEPFRELYEGRPEARQVRRFYDSVRDIPATEKYKRVISIAVLEHMENLPREIALAALHLTSDGLFQAGIPSEGGVLWGLAWRMSTGVAYYLRTGLDYAAVMRHEHINRAPEILSIVKYLFKDVQICRFPLPFHHLSFYAYIEARKPHLDRCRTITSGDTAS